MLVKKRIEIITAQYVFSKENTVEARDKESRKARKKCLTKLKIEAHSNTPPIAYHLTIF